MTGISGIDLGPEISKWIDILDDTDIKDDGKENGKLIQIQSGPNSDGYTHYMIPPATWKKNVIGRKVKGSEYLYFPVAS